MSANHPDPGNDPRRDDADRAQVEAVALEGLARALRAYAATMSRRPDADMDAIARRMVAAARETLLSTAAAQ